MIIHNCMKTIFTAGGVSIPPNSSGFIPNWDDIKHGKVIGKLLAQGLLFEEGVYVDETEEPEEKLEQETEEHKEYYEAGYP